MAISIDWHPKIINVPRADMLLLQTNPTEIRQLNIDDFRKELNDISDSEEGIWADTTHYHSPPTTVAGVELARVVSMINGYTVTFEDGVYAVNITGGNSNISDVNNKNQVSVNTANSAGLMDIGYMQAAAFQGEIAVDVTSIYTGTTFPVGTRSYPVNNIADAHDIAVQRGLSVFLILQSMSLGDGDFSDGHVFKGLNPSTVTITVLPAAEVSNCEFREATIQGTLDNANIFREASLLDVTHVNGFITRCALFGTVTLGGSQQAMIVDSASGIAGGGPGDYPYIDMGGSGNSLALRGWDGGLGIINSTGSDASSLDVNSGRVVFYSSCTDGDFTVRGICDVTDNSTGATINDYSINATLLNSIIAEELTAEQSAAEHTTIRSTDPLVDPGKIVLRNTTVSRRWEADAWEDEDGGIGYRGNGLEKVGMLVEVAWS